MDTPPINLFSNKIDPQGVLQLVLDEHPDATVEKDPDAGHWTSVTVSRKRGLFKKSASLVINHNPDYYGGEGWSRQRDGMAGYFQKFPLEDLQRARLLATVGGFGFALSCTSDPPVWPDEDDFRNDLISKMAAQLEACIFIPGALLDSEYRTLASADGEVDPEAQFPDHAMRVQAQIEVPGSLSEGSGELADDDRPDDLDPPSPERVAARAMVLGCIAVRGLMDLDASQLEEGATAKIETRRQQLVARISEAGLGVEFEPAEKDLLDTPVGGLSEQQQLNSTWRFEGLAVLAWALRLRGMPAYDQVTETRPLIDALGIMADDPSVSQAILANPDLRPPDHVEILGEQIFAFHWRMRDFSLRPVAMDFVEFGKTCWFGPLDLSWAKLNHGDLELDGATISAAAPDTITSCNSIAQERHLAINWLRGQSEIYSETDTST